MLFSRRTNCVWRHVMRPRMHKTHGSGHNLQFRRSRERLRFAGERFWGPETPHKQHDAYIITAFLLLRKSM